MREENRRLTRVCGVADDEPPARRGAFGCRFV